ncbi:MAG: hypothetical protein K8R02_05575 [Anaerohalosphaeraceae bacterium]|nr:hypothetical protein [Anaerohalosphaeraceae bacterium]
MNWLDWTVISVFCVSIVIIGMSFVKRSSGSMVDFFLAGRKLPWWLAGLSMLATNFGSDTPLHQAGNARKEGLTAFWFYLRGVIGELSLAFLFARLWRRAKVLTDVEFFELRHGKGCATALRVIIASYNCFLFVPLKIGLFTLAMCKIAKVIFEMPDTVALLGYSFDAHMLIAITMVLFALMYSATSGLWGVAITDFIEWFIAIFGTYVLLVLVYREVGGPSAMVAQLQELMADGTLPSGFTKITPKTFLSPVLIMMFIPWWWFNAGSLAPAQRLMACRSEKDAMLSQLMRTILNNVVRSWPWIICGIGSIIIFANVYVANPNDAYPMLIYKLMPHGLLGLMMASFLAAFLSSTDTYLNLGSAYFMNDLYRRFLVKDKSEHHYVTASRLTTVVLAIMGIIVVLLFSDVFELFKFLAKILAGVGIIKALRWYWWRINGPAELAATIAAVVTSTTFFIMKSFYFTAERVVQIADGVIPTTGVRPPAQWLIDTFHITEPLLPSLLYFIVEINLIAVIGVIVWITTMYLTKPDSTEALKEYYRRVRPAGPGWKPIAKLCPEVKITDSLSADFLAWFIGCVFCYSLVFAVGAAYFVRWKLVAVMAVIGIVSGILLKYKILDRYDRMAAIDRELEMEEKHN